jgi:HPt (histidine-containing phosphotransfer) domain-containing protein
MPIDTVIQNLENICIESETLAKTSKWKDVESFFTETAQKWNSLDPKGEHPELKKRFADAHSAFNIRLANDKTRRTRIAEREALCDEIEKYSCSQNPNEFADRVKKIKSDWRILPGIPEAYLEILQKRLENALQLFSKQVELLHERLPEVEHLCKIAEDLAEGSEWNISEKELKKIKERWLQVISDVRGLEKFKERFDKAVENFISRKTEFANTIEAERKLLAELCGEMELCLNAENLKSVLPKVKEIKSRWKISEISDVEKEKLQKHFKSLLRSYHKKINEIFEEEDWSRWENYTMKLGLCEKAEKLFAENSFQIRSQTLKSLQEEWKRIGSVPKEKSNELWERFRTNCDKIYQTCREFFEEQNRIRAEHLLKKTALCEQAEALQNSEEWENTADKLKNLQSEWNGIGPVPRGKEEAIFQRFRNPCNIFFERRKAHYKELHKIQSENKKFKISLCEEAESLLNKQDLRQTLRIASELRNEWRNAPHAGRKDEQSLWERFNSALTKFYEKADLLRNENLLRKQEISTEIEKLSDSPEMKTDCDRIAGIVKNLKDEWKNIWPPPRDREKEMEMEDKFHSLLRLFEDRYRESRRELQSTLDKNVCLREAILQEITGFAFLDDTVSGNIEEALAGFESKWNSVGPVPKEKSDELDARFREALTALKNKDVGFFSSTTLKQVENLKIKKKLCVELEQLAGAPSTEGIEPEKGVSTDLINELRLAIESNFGMSDQLKKENIGETMDRFDRILRKWDKTGPVPTEEREKLEMRFQNAAESFRRKYAGRNLVPKPGYGRNTNAKSEYRNPKQ